MIIGAGASHDLGFPLGDDLKQNIASILGGNDIATSSWFLDCVALQNGNNQSQGKLILDRARSFEHQIRGAASIDNFLDQHRDEEGFVRAGKAAIYFSIAVAEQGCKIGKKFRDGSIQLVSPEYFVNPLMQILSRNHTRADILESLANLTFITFNYDRAIERSIYIWLKNNFEFEYQDIKPYLNVIHVYGSLGEYSPGSAGDYFQAEGQFPLQNPHLELPRLYDKIRLFTEQQETSLKSRITSELDAAKCIFYLGFGFEEQNTRLIQSRAPRATVFATTYDMSGSNAENVRQRLSRMHGVPKHWVDKLIRNHFGKAQDLFKDHYFEIADAVGSISSPT